jgi:hypothetical protein
MHEWFEYETEISNDRADYRCDAVLAMGSSTHPRFQMQNMDVFVVGCVEQCHKHPSSRFVTRPGLWIIFGAAIYQN